MVAARGLEGSFDVAHARTLAPDVVVFDHAPGSEWIYYGAEERLVARSASPARPTSSFRWTVT